MEPKEGDARAHDSSALQPTARSGLMLLQCQNNP